MTISIDFDSTITQCLDFPWFHAKPRPGAKKYINKLYKDGHYIMINTCRVPLDELLRTNYKFDEFTKQCSQERAEIFLFENKIKYHAINRHSPMNVLKYRVGGGKLAADVYIDDKSLGVLSGKQEFDWETIYKDVCNIENKII